MLQNSVNYDTRERISRIFKYDLESKLLKNKKQNSTLNKIVRFFKKEINFI